MKLNETELTIFLKCAEELNELSTALLQQINKPKKNKITNIYEEILDVEKWILLLKNNLKDLDQTR